MERGDRGQDLVAPGALLGECALQDRDTLGDLGGVPQGAVLLVERHEPAVRVGARRAAGRAGAASAPAARELPAPVWRA